MTSKQKTLHSASPILVGLALCAALWISCIVAPKTSGAADKTTQTLGDQVASMRLLVEAGPTNGRYRAGVEIAMQPGSHTYWKQPGDAGVPPVFSFNGSQNVAKAEVVFPTPMRINESGIEAFGYTDRVVFPIVVTPQDAGRPALLKVDVSYAVCRNICLPTHGSATINLDPGGEGIEGRKVASALAEVPIPMTARDRQALSIVRIKGDQKPSQKPTWTLTWSGPTPVEDIFADAPEGFYFETRKLAPNTFSLTAAQIVSAQKTNDVPVSLTLARKRHSLATTETLDVAGSTN